MKVTKFPDDLNPNLIIKEKCMKRDFICPYCGTRNNKIKEMLHYFDNTTAYFTEPSLFKSDIPIEWQQETWFGYQDGKLHLFSKQKRQTWAKFLCHCTKCNAEWEGEPFIILSKKELKE